MGSRVNGATPTWDGYTHQGKVGLIVVLVEITRLINDTKATLLKDELSQWSIVFEGAEDFDIRNQDTNAWSRHQVKAYIDKTAQKDYNTVLLYNEEKSKPGFKTNGVRENECYLHTVAKISDWSFDREKNLYGVKLYEYPTRKSYCDYSKPGENTSIKEIYTPLLAAIMKVDDQNLIDTIWSCLEHKLDDAIRIGHQNKTRPTLDFLTTYEFIARKEPFLEDEYQRLKRIVSKCWAFHQEIKCKRGEADSDDFLKAKILVDRLLDLQRNEFMEAFRLMHPDESNIELNVNMKGMRRVVYEGMEKINQPLNLDSMSYINTLNDRYILTSLDEENERFDSYAAGICEQMLHNSDANFILFHKSNLINLEIDQSFRRLVDKTALGGLQLHETSQLAGHAVEHVLDPVDFRFVPLAKAIDELNTGKG